MDHSIAGTSSHSLPSPPVLAFGAPLAPLLSITTPPIAGDVAARVSFSPPLNNGGADIVAYTVTSVPGRFSSIALASANHDVHLLRNTH
jgi:hypothetical protein